MAKLYASRSPGISEREQRNFTRARKIAAQGMVLLENDGILPLKDVRTLAAYGNGVRYTVKGGIGSGDVNSRTVVNAEQGLNDAGFILTSTRWLDRFDTMCTEARETYNAEVRRRMAEDRMAGIRMILESPYQNPDVPRITPDELADKADATLYIIARNSGEGRDRRPEPGDYELSEGEKKNLEILGTVYDRIIVVLNVGGVIDTRFLRACPQVAAVLLMSQAGNISGCALADVLTGKVTPSGHLAMTWAEKYTDYASAATFSHMNGDVDDEYYTDGIYVGYRYFDTFGISPAYPFGYGLSYTTFDVRTDNVALDGTVITVKAAVTNTGSVFSGREVVQVYVSGPVSDLARPYQELRGFAKTKLLLPGESEQLEIRFDARDMASYSESDAAFVLDPGKYYIRVGTHSRSTHVAAAVELSERKVVSQLKNQLAPDVDLELITPEGRTPYGYPAENAEKAAAPVLILDPAAIVTETIGYSGAPELLTTDKTETVTLDDVIAGKASLEDLAAQLTVEEMADLTVGTARFGSVGAASTIGAASTAVPGAAGDTTSKLIESRKIPNMALADGPAGLRLSTHFVADAEGTPIPGLNSGAIGGLNLRRGPAPERPADAVDYYQYCTAIPIATLLAQTWDMEAVEEAGDIVGEEMEEFGVALWLAPGMNIQRNPLCGRNFEYYSEDPLVSGLCAAADTAGVQKHPGCGTCIKHFALNNQESNRKGNNAHATERTIREIYLKGFETAVKRSQPLSLMTSYNLLNGEHTANKYELVTHILRDEWGFEGLVMTDWSTTGGGVTGKTGHYPVSDAGGCIKAGNDLIMPGNEKDLNTVIRSVGAKEGDEGVLYPITKAELQSCALHILRIILKREVDLRK